MHKVVFRADDAGSSRGANLAIVQTVREGVVRNVSVMAPGPALEHAVPLLRELQGVNLGLHVTLSAEWDRIKWGPVACADRVPTLVDSRGKFTASPRVLHDRGFSVDEAMLEVEAQLRLLRECGLRISYLDQHMGVGWLPGLGERLRELGDREGLLDTSRLPYLEGTDTQGVNRLMDAIKAAPGGPYVVVSHPGSDEDPAMHQFTFGDIRPGSILAERARDRQTLTDTRLLKAVEAGTIESVTYQEAALMEGNDLPYSIR